MKVLAIVGSPRKGQTHNVIERIQAEMSKLGPVDFEILMLKDLDLQFCRGCELCITKGEQFCPLNDDRTMVLEKIQAADGLILASPVYAIQVTAQMKLLLDRFAFMFHRPRLFSQKALLVTTGGMAFGDPFKCLGNSARAWGIMWVRKLGLTRLDSLSGPPLEKAEAKIRKEANAFYRALQDPTPRSPSFFRLMWFNIWKQNTQALSAFNPCDFQYWQAKGWYQRPFYYDVRINPLKKLVVNGLISLMGLMMPKPEKK